MKFDRFQIRTKLDKQSFISRMNECIELRNELVEFYNNTYLPLLQKFDGKVLNKRFINAVAEEAKKCKHTIFVKLNDNLQEVILNIKHSGWNYNDTETLYTKIVVNSEKRISYEESVNHEIGQTWLKNFAESTNEYQMSIDNFDEYMAKAEELQRLIQDYGELPYPFRYQCVDGGSFSTYLLR